MSFSKAEKEEIIRQAEKNLCCRRAMLNGVFAAKASLCPHGTELFIDGETNRAYIASLIEEIYGKTVEIIPTTNGGRGKTMRLTAPSAFKFVEGLSAKHSFLELCKQKCQGCHSAFFRGVFLASGRISDPKKQYCLEFSLAERAELFMELFREQGFEPRFTERRGERIIYFKSGTQIEDFFALAGMNNTVFEIIYAKINSESRNNANRIANCETNNIGKAINASLKHINAIRDLDEANQLSSLPDELEKTARLRLQYTDLSLSQLANIAVPAITKSGLSHRLNKILEIAEQKLHKKYT